MQHSHAPAAEHCFVPRVHEGHLATTQWFPPAPEEPGPGLEPSAHPGQALPEPLLDEEVDAGHDAASQTPVLASGDPEELDIGPWGPLGTAPSDAVEPTPLDPVVPPLLAPVVAPPLEPVVPPLLEPPAADAPASSAQTQSPKPLPFAEHTW
jgi:hypothetical protein